MPTDMNSAIRFFANAAVLAGVVLLAAPGEAGVKEGVDAWSRGDYAAALREWEAPAAAGDADGLPFSLVGPHPGDGGGNLLRAVDRDPSDQLTGSRVGHLELTDLHRHLVSFSRWPWPAGQTIPCSLAAARNLSVDGEKVHDMDALIRRR